MKAKNLPNAGAPGVIIANAAPGPTPADGARDQPGPDHGLDLTCAVLLDLGWLDEDTRD